MAALCPQCGTSLEQDFGVVSCPQCHSVLVINLDGQIEIQNESPSEITSSSEEVSLEIQTEDHFDNSISEDNFQFQEAPPNEEMLVEEISEASISVVPEPLFIPDPPQALANSSSSVISYHVTIEGIDTKNLRVLLEDALSDSKFPWTSRDVVKQTNNGILELGPMNPVVASVLVRKLKDLPLTVKWKQSIYE